MSYLQILNLFRSSRVTVDLTTTGPQQLLAARKKRCARYEVLKHTVGKRSVFHV